MNRTETKRGEASLRIVHVITRHLGSGGTERNLEFTANWEAQRGHQVDVIYGTLDPQHHGFSPSVRLLQLPTLVRPPRPVADLRALIGMRRLLRRGAYDVIHTHQSKAGIIGRLAARGIVPRIVHTVHMAAFGPGYPRLQSRAYVLVERYCAGFTDLIITVGQDLRRNYLEARIGRPAQYEVVRSPIDLGRFTAVRKMTPSERSAARRALGLSSGPAIIAAAGLLEPRKRFDLMISRLAPLLRGGQVVLVIAGKGTEEARLRALARLLGVADQVTLAGQLPKLENLFAVASLFVHTSTAEGVPQVLIQALAAGLPAVVTRVDGVMEVDGAPVTVLAESGLEMDEACRRALSGVRNPVDLAALSPWSAPEIERDLARVHGHGGVMAAAG